MKKKLVLILLIIIVCLFAGYFILNKINESKRNYQLEQISEFDYFVYKEKDNFGVIDKQGKVIISAIYEKVEIPNPSKDIFICSKDGKSIAIDSNSKQLFAEYNTIEAIKLKNVVNDLQYEKSVLKAEKNGDYGLIDLSGKKILNTEYSSIEGVSGIEGEIEVIKDEKHGIVNLKGTPLVKCEYDTVVLDNYYNEEKKHGYIVGVKNESGYNYGYIDYKGKQTVKLEYNDISRVTDVSTDEGIYLIAAKNGQYGVIKNNKIIINNEYQSIDYDKTNKIFILRKNKNYGVADINGKVIISVENTNIQAKGEYIYAEKNNVKEVYDSLGNKVDVEFNKIITSTTNDNYRIIINTEENGNFYGVINKDKKQIVKSDYLYLEYAYGNYFIACSKNGKLGVIDDTGKTVIEFKYDLAQKLQGKNLVQTLNSETNTTEVYSENMEKICEMPNAVIENQDNYIKIYSDKDIKYIDNNGKTLKSYEVLPNNKIYASFKNGKWGYEDNSGKTVVNYEYDLANELNEYGFAAVKKDGKWGVINSDGQIILEPKIQLNDNYGKIEFIGEYLKINNGFGNVYYTKDIK